MKRHLLFVINLLVVASMVFAPVLMWATPQVAAQERVSPTEAGLALPPLPQSSTPFAPAAAAPSHLTARQVMANLLDIELLEMGGLARLDPLAETAPFPPPSMIVPEEQTDMPELAPVPLAGSAVPTATMAVSEPAHTVFLPFMSQPYVISAVEGGAISLPGGTFTATFAADGLPAPLIVSLEEDSTTALPSHFILMGPKVAVRATWQDSGQPAVELDPDAGAIIYPGAAKPLPVPSNYWATLTVRLRPGQTDNQHLAIARLDQRSGKWEILPTQLHKEAGVATAETDRLGVFALIENAALWGKGNQSDLFSAGALFAPGDEVIVDDGNAGFKEDEHDGSVDYFWPVECGAFGSCWGGDALWTYNRSEFEPLPLEQPWNWAKWTPNLPEAGYYYVSVWIPANKASTAGAEYEIHHAGLVDRVIVNQNENRGKWVDLGAFEFTAVNDGNELVYLDDVVPEEDEYPNGNWSRIGYDAVKFVYAGTEPPPPVDNIPPTIHWVNRWLDGNGGAVIRAKVTDNVAVRDVSLIFNGVRYLMTPIGGNLYEAAVAVPLDQESDFQIVAVDTAGRVATYPPNSQFHVNGYLSKNLGDYNSTCVMLGCSGPGYQGSEADPVNTANGNFFYHTADLAVPGVGETTILIDRGYNSLPNEPQGVISYRLDEDGNVQEVLSQTHPALFGRGWTFPLATHLLVLDNALFQGVEVRYGDGHVVHFVDEGGGDFRPLEPRVYDELTADGGDYLLQMRDLTTYRFDSNGRLQSITDRNGNVMSMSYTDGQLTAVTNAAGRTVTFVYNDEGFISDIYAPEGRHLRYSYENGRLRFFHDGRGNVTEYKYNAAGRLIAVITPEGHPALRLSYDDTLGRVTQQIVGAHMRYTFTYDDATHATTIHDVYGQPMIHFYDAERRLVEARDALGLSEYYGYDDNNNRTYFQDREGRQWRYTYDERGNRLSEEGPLGWHREWDYNTLDLVTRMEDALGRETFLSYDARGNLTQITNAAGDTSTVTYNGRGLPTRVLDFNGNETLNTYDPVTGNLTHTRNGAGDTVQYTYDGLGRLHTLTNGRHFAYAYTYDGNDNLTAVAGPLGYEVSYGYDKNDNLTLEVDPNGGGTSYQYDASENLVRLENQLGFPMLYAYDNMDNLVRMEDAEGQVWRYEYNEVYNRVAEHGPEDTHTFYAYDAVDNITAVTRCNSPVVANGCPVSQVTHYQYDDLNRLVTQVENVVDGAGQTAATNVTTTYTYDLVDNLLSVTDALGNQMHYDYDDLDRLIRQEDAADQVTRYQYDSMGNLARLTNPRGYETIFTYEGANRLQTMRDAQGNTWTYAYDGNGNLAAVTDPLGVVTHYDYDPLDRASSVTENFVAGAPATTPQNVTTGFEYDLAGNLRFVDDPRGGYTTEHRYDAAHRRILTVDAGDGETRYGYDRAGNLVSLVDANGHETTFAYDGLYRQVRITNPEGHHVGFTYDRLDNLLLLADARGSETTFAYDGMNRPILRTDPLNGTWRYTYDALGNLLQERDANGHVDTYAYDDVYRLTAVTDAENHTTSFTYDANGNRLTLTDGNDHATIYTYDELDRLVTMTNAEQETTTYQYDPLDNQTHLIEADGIVTLYQYDALYRLAAVTQNYQLGQPESADLNVDTHYSYDEVDNLLSILDANEHATRFRYDGLNRLVQEIDAGGNTWHYEYDAVGNRTARIDANGNRTAYAYYPDNQLQQISYQLDGTTVSYTYDENNNRLAMADHLGTTTWVYDALNRVTAVTDPFGRQLGYTYDAVGNRTGLTYADGRTLTYAYYDNDWLHAVTDPAGNTTTYTRDGVGLPVLTSNPNDTVSEATYDRANRLLALNDRQTSGAQETISAFSYTYNEIGHRTQMVAEYGWRQPAVVTSTYTYDGLRRLLRDENSEGVWAQYTFDRVGNRLVLETNDDTLSPRPFDAQTLYYSYSDSNRLLSIVDDTHPSQPGSKRQDSVAQAIYAFRHEVTAQRGKHISESAATTLLLMAGALIDDLEGDPAANESAVTAAIEDLRSQVLADRTDGRIDSDGIANGLLMKLELGDRANGETAGDLQATTFTYDANGNRTGKAFPGPSGPQMQGTDYAYDAENRLIEALDYQMNDQGHRVDRAVTTLQYDGGGRRLAKTYDAHAGGGEAKRVEYLFDGLDPVAKYNTGTPQYDNFYRGGQNRILTMHHFPNGTAGQTYWYHYDGLGSVSGLTKQHGQATHNYRYRPYGQIEMPPGNFTGPHNHYTFTGKEWDENTGLYYFGARHYDAAAGVWTTQDKFRGILRAPISLHRYGYTHSSPINHYDLYGYIIPAIVVAAAGGAVVNVASRYTGDVVTNIVEGKQGLDIIKPSSSMEQSVGSAVLVCPQKDCTESILNKIYENAGDFGGNPFELIEKARAGGIWDYKKHIKEVYGDTIQICGIPTDHGVPGNLNFCYQAKSVDKLYSNRFVLYNAGNVDEVKKRRTDLTWFDNWRRFGHTDNPWDRTACDIGLEIVQKHPNQCVTTETFCSIYTQQKIFTPEDAKKVEEPLF